MSRLLSAWACKLSIQYLFRAAGERQLSDPPAPLYCYLWTLTFPDAETRGDARLAMKRWDSFRVWLFKHNRIGVRAIEKSPVGLFHFHIATPQRWDAKEMWDVGERYGFGRVNVRRRPIERAYYIAKYVGKGAGGNWLPRGMRQWACFGFEGVSQRTVRIRDSERIVVPHTSDDKLYTVLQWVSGDFVLCRVRLRPAEGVPDVTKTMEIKPQSQKELIDLLAKGETVAVGEYRGMVVRKQSITDYKTKQAVERVLVEHCVEFGGVSQVVTEWTPAGTNPEGIKASANRGDAVLVTVEGKGKYKGTRQMSGMIRPLIALPLRQVA